MQDFKVQIIPAAATKRITAAKANKIGLLTLEPDFEITSINIQPSVSNIYWNKYTYAMAGSWMYSIKHRDQNQFNKINICVFYNIFYIW